MIKNSFIYIYLCLFCICSCQQYPVENYSVQIIGKWRPIDYKPEEYGYKSYLHGYHFTEDGLCEYYPGFFSYFIPNGLLLHDPLTFCPESRLPFHLFGGQTALNNVIRFHGNKSSYRLTGDTLRIYDPAKNVWIDQHIHFESLDTMILSYIDECSQQVHIPFERVTYQTDDSHPFDQLIFYYPSGSQLSRAFLIQRNGLFLSYGYKGYRKLFVGKINDDDMGWIERMFKQVDFENIKPDEMLGSFAFKPKLAIIRGNEMKIISAMTVTDKNKEFYWTYLSTLFSPDNLHIQPINPEEYIKNDFLDIKSNIFSYRKFTGESNLYLGEIKSFYLIQLLMTAPEADIEFTSTHNIIIQDKPLISFETDGRYYRFTDNNNNIKILDIGVNFIKDIKMDYINTYEQYGVEIYYK